MSLGSQISDILHERTNYDFVGLKKRWFTLSAVAMLLGIAALGIRGLNLGMEFKGGTAWEVKVQGDKPTVGGARDVVQGAGLDNAAVKILGSDTVRATASKSTLEQQEAVRAALAEYANATTADVSISDVGSSWGEEVTRKALEALLIFFVVVTIYLWLRLEWKMALAALAAVVHDILLTIAAYAITGFDVTPATVIALLTILGFSLYDTVVVFDKVEENVAGIGSSGKDTYSAVVNRSMNEVLMRSLNTTFVAVLPVFSLLVVGSFVFGARSLQDFALALFIGLIAGTYSSIFVATPLLAVMKEREPRYAAIRQRLAGRAATVAAPAHSTASPAGAGSRVGGPSGGGRVLDTPEAEADAGESGRPPRVAPRPVPTRRPGGTAAPRPRQKRRKR